MFEDRWTKSKHMPSTKCTDIIWYQYQEKNRLNINHVVMHNISYWKQYIPCVFKKQPISKTIPLRYTNSISLSHYTNRFLLNGWWLQLLLCGGGRQSSGTNRTGNWEKAYLSLIPFELKWPLNKNKKWGLNYTSLHVKLFGFCFFGANKNLQNNCELAQNLKNVMWEIQQHVPQGNQTSISFWGHSRASGNSSGAASRGRLDWN